jgi:hypothetical protein
VPKTLVRDHPGVSGQRAVLSTGTPIDEPGSYLVTCATFLHPLFFGNSKVLEEGAMQVSWELV